MCGICGIVRTDAAPPIRTAVLERMRDTLYHRGPDGSGTFEDAHCGLGHRRLSIVDVAHGQQPMYSDDGRFVVVYNGEVFNHPEVKTTLEAAGVVYRTRSDTETVLRLYERDGLEFVRHLRGMFAIAIWDRAQRKLILARDRFGVKPLYVTQHADGSLSFASEIKALLSAQTTSPVLDLESVPDFLANHAPSGEATLFRGVKRLPAGHVLEWQDGEVRVHQYWDLAWNGVDTTTVPSPARERDLVEEYRERFTAAVEMRLMSDVPLGMFLSGGIDSAAITAVMSGLVSDRIKTFSVAFAEREANEFAYARLVAERFRTDHHEVVLSPHDFWESLPKLIWHEDEPLAHPSSVALHAVSRLAAQHVKVVLTGEGSDETLAGYNRYRVTIYNQRLGAMWARLLPGVARSGVAQVIRALPERSRTRQRAERTFLTRGAGLDDLYFDNFAVFGRAAQRVLLSPAVAQSLVDIDPYQAYHDALGRTDAVTELNRLLYADTKTYLHELLMKQDQMSMAASIESRVPFLDHPLVEWVAQLPDVMKLRGTTTKWILRAAMKGRLPDEILGRRKMGFPVPVGAWFRGDWSWLLDEYVLGARARERGLFASGPVQALVAEHRAGTRNHAERLWALVTFEMWHRIFVDGEDAALAPRPATRRVA